MDKKLMRAANLLLDDQLVWSADMERIRKPLGAWLHYQAELREYSDQLAHKIADNLLDEDDLTIPNPIEEYRAGKSI